VRKKKKQPRPRAADQSPKRSKLLCRLQLCHWKEALAAVRQFGRLHGGEEDDRLLAWEQRRFVLVRRRRMEEEGGLDCSVFRGELAGKVRQLR
jgi:hypothetical protein